MGKHYFLRVALASRRVLWLVGAMLVAVQSSGEPGAPPVECNDTNDAIRYSADWTAWTGTGPHGNSLHYANQPGKTLTLDFSGSSISLVHKTGADCGIARVTIDDDDAKAIEIDTYAPTVDWNHFTLLAEKLPPGKHTVTIHVTGRKHPEASNTYVQIVGFAGQDLVPYSVIDTASLQDDLERLGPEADALREEFANLTRSGVSPDSAQWHELRVQTSEKAREAALRRCPPFAFVKRHHFRSPGAGGVLLCWDAFTPGGGIYTYDPRHPDNGEREIFRRDDGVVFDMSPSYDAQTLLFSWKVCDPNEPFHVYEINVDGTGLRQITNEHYHDVSPAYLPDGRIVFISTRVRSFSMCQDAPASAMHVMNPDGSGIHRIQFGTLADFSPYVLDNGSILFTRWEYQDKSVFSIQSLWTIHPDGTLLNLFYGNTITIPNTIWQARPLPGSDRYVCTMAPHHGNLVGAIGVLDRNRGIENPSALRNITPEIPYTPTTDPDWRPGDVLHYWSYRDPWPVGEDLMLVAYGGGGVNRYRLYLMDTEGHKEPLLEDVEISCFNPVPLVPRRLPHQLPKHESLAEANGTFFLADVYQGLTGVARGEVKALRVMSQMPRPTNNRGRRAYFMGHDIVDPVTGAGTFYVKYNHGTVPVSEEGSAYFCAPAGMELYFQALDADGKELCRMGSLTQLMPGETQSCVGCHEPRFSAPPVATASSAQLLRHGPVDITPPAWGAGPVDFARQVQPVLDRYCGKCHSGPAPKAGLDFSGDKTRWFNMAYDNLVARNLVQFYYLTPPQEETGNFLPLRTGSRVSKVVQMIERGHGKVEMDVESRQRLYTWIEANVPYYGTYEHTRPGTPGSRDAWSDGTWFSDLQKTYDAQGCAACHGNIDDTSALRQTWINLTHPEWSRLLGAHLAQEAGGLGLNKKQDGKCPPTFNDKTDPAYRAMLAAIQEGSRMLWSKPRMDMANAKPQPYEQDFGRLYPQR